MKYHKQQLTIRESKFGDGIMRLFVIRPFGVKNDIDFDKVHEQLIQKAIDEVVEPGRDINGATTAEIVSAGNIREDMFEMILSAELVIADMSIHNANVFYELGIRHAMREGKTILIRCRVKDHEIPFDLRTDRTLIYDYENLSGCVSELTATIKATIASEEIDSPVFKLVPNLVPPDLSTLIVAPRAFREQLEIAKERCDRNALRALLEKNKTLGWANHALREIGKAAYELEDYSLAKEAMEGVVVNYSEDAELNTKLGTIYQRLGDLVRSDEALKRVLRTEGPTPYERAETRSGLARNHKIRWEQKWFAEEKDVKRQEAALRSPHLSKCLDEYCNAYKEDRNHYYSGINALAMTEVKRWLIHRYPEVWRGFFKTEKEANCKRKVLEESKISLAAGIELSIESAKSIATDAQNEERLRWAAIAHADLIFLTSTSKQYGLIAQTYSESLADAGEFYLSSVRKQINRYQELGLFSERCKAALEGIDG